MLTVFYLIPLLFDFYDKEFKLFTEMEIKEYKTQQECIIDMNKLNNKFEIEHSAIRVVCVEK
jgi:hypothetical protein